MPEGPNAALSGGLGRCAIGTLTKTVRVDGVVRAAAAAKTNAQGVGSCDLLGGQRRTKMRNVERATDTANSTSWFSQRRAAKAQRERGSLLAETLVVYARTISTT